MRRFWLAPSSRFFGFQICATILLFPSETKGLTMGGVYVGEVRASTVMHALAVLPFAFELLLMGRAPCRVDDKKYIIWSEI